MAVLASISLIVGFIPMAVVKKVSFSTFKGAGYSDEPGQTNEKLSANDTS